MDKPNTPSTIITFSATIVALAGLGALVIVTGRDPIPFFVALAAMVPTIGNFLLTRKVDKQTNGNNQELRQRNDELQAENAALRTQLTPEQVASVPTIPTPTTDGYVIEPTHPTDSLWSPKNL